MMQRSPGDSFPTLKHRAESTKPLSGLMGVRLLFRHTVSIVLNLAVFEGFADSALWLQPDANPKGRVTP